MFPFNGMNYIHIASQKGLFAVVECLMKKDVDLNAIDRIHYYFLNHYFFL